AARDPLEPRPPELAETALDPVADDRRADALRHREAEPRFPVVVAREPVERQEPRRHRAPVPVDGVEVPRARQAGAALPRRRLARQAESRFRPLARRRLRISLPARVAIRARKPCLRFRLRTLGW